MVGARGGSKLAVVGGTPVVPAGRHHAWPEVTQADRDAVRAVLDSGELWGVHGKEVLALQEEFADYCGVPHCLTVNSGTAALHAGVVAAGVRPEDEVITSALSFVASAMAIAHAGARPVFCDVDEHTFNIDPRKISSLVTERTRAILPVHVGGLPADMDAIRAVARTHGLVVIEDAAQAAGATYHGDRAGALGSKTAGFSFNGTKCPSGMEGGAFVTSDEECLKAARRLAVVGEDTPRPGPGEVRAYWSRGLGWQYRMHEVTAAFTRSQLRRADSYIAMANENAAILTAGLSDLPGIEPPYVPPGCGSSFYLYRAMFDPESFGWEGTDVEFRDRLLFALEAEGLAVSTWQLWPLPQQPVWRCENPDAWRPGDDDRPQKSWDREQYQVTRRVLERSVIIGSLDKSLHVQEAAVMKLYVEGIQKVLSQMDVVLNCPYEPLRVAPAIPADEL